tara:strand:- start:391 stop:1632 length:1242 start_codon:yes stop_codon:yes gene_type:complete
MIKRTNCRMCESTRLKKVLNLGTHSLVNSYIKKKDLNKKELLLPLIIHQCINCGLIQMLKTVDPRIIYSGGKYLYFSKDIPGLEKYYKEYANTVYKKFVKSKKDLVIEIASNDGILLQHLIKKTKVLGIDAAPNAVLRALKENIPTFPSLFNDHTAKLVSKEYGEAKVVMANQCIAHVDNLIDFMSGVDRLLNKKKGIFIFETGYWTRMVDRTIYEQIYHDHFSYFSLEVWKKFCKRFDLKLFDAVVTPAQDNCSIRVFFSKNKKIKETNRLKKLIKYEKINKINSYKTSKIYEKKVKNSWRILKKELIKLKKNKKTIVAYGASAKSGTISRCADLGKNLIDFYIDDSPSKQGLFTPIYNIPILSKKEGYKKKIDYLLILAVNYADMIIKKEKEFGKKGGKFIVPRGETIQYI